VAPGPLAATRACVSRAGSGRRRPRASAARRLVQMDHSATVGPGRHRVRGPAHAPRALWFEWTVVGLRGRRTDGALDGGEEAAEREGLVDHPSGAYLGYPVSRV